MRWEQFHHPAKLFHVPSQRISSLPNPRQHWPVCSPSLWFCLFQKEWIHTAAFRVWLLSLSITPLRLIYLVACVSIGWAVFHDLSIHLLVDDCFQFGVIMRKVALNVISLSFLNLYTKHKTKKSEQLTHFWMLNCIFYIQKNINLSTEMSPLSKYCLKYGHSKNMWIQFFYLWKKGKK